MAAWRCAVLQLDFNGVGGGVWEFQSSEQDVAFPLGKSKYLQGVSVGEEWASQLFSVEAYQAVCIFIMCCQAGVHRRCQNRAIQYVDLKDSAMALDYLTKDVFNPTREWFIASMSVPFCDGFLWSSNC